MRISKLSELKKFWLVLVSGLVVAIAAFWLYQLTSDNPVVLGLNTDYKPGILQLELPELVSINQPFTTYVKVNSMGNDINAVGVFLHYDPQRLQVLSLNTTNSFCQFYPEKKFDNYAGKIALACGSPHPGMNGEGTLMTIEFLPLMMGTTFLRTSPDSQLLVSDGKGTNILTKYPSAAVNVVTRL